MPGMQLGTGTPSLRGLMRSLVFETSGDDGLIDSSQVGQDGWLNLAHRQLYNEIAHLSPTVFAKRSADTTIDSTGRDTSGTLLDAQGVHVITMVEYKDQVGNYRQISPIQYVEKDMIEGPSWLATGAAVYRWTLLGQTILFYPTPGRTETIRITYVPGIADLSATTDYPFSGNLREFHELVAYLAAVLLLEKDEASKFLRARYEVLHKQLVEHVRRRQTQRSRHVLMTEWPEV